MANQVHGADADFLVGIEQPLRDSDGNGVGVSLGLGAMARLAPGLSGKGEQ